MVRSSWIEGLIISNLLVTTRLTNDWMEFINLCPSHLRILFDSDNLEVIVDLQSSTWVITEELN